MAYCKFLFKFYVPLKIVGEENLIEGPCILCSNHNSHMDSIVLILSSGSSFSKVGLLAAADYWFNDRLKGKVFSKLLCLIPIDRSKRINKLILEEKTIDACRDFIGQSNRKLLIYPEGNRSSDGKLQLPFKKGPALFSYELGIPIIPAYIHGTFESWPKGNIFMKPGKVSVAMGKPIYPHMLVSSDMAMGKNGRKALINQMTKDLEQAIIDLRGQS